MSLDGVFGVLDGGGGLKFSPDLLHVALSIFGVGYFMRIVDELRDYVWLTTGWLFLLPLGMAVSNLTLFFKSRRPRALSGRLAARSYFAFLFVILMAAFTWSVAEVGWTWSVAALSNPYEE
ncbi:hypothetical protein [Corallococcus sp. AB045]|uniref:hypothetical protein n=1 Tax=Corallococcus sp. AB045 TaxID=2316719 RepID=UPI0018F6CF2B|nr:hypothetical protein [Corallococcus sp. AB045]